jgi:hypothetical protein
MVIEALTPAKRHGARVSRSNDILWEILGSTATRDTGRRDPCMGSSTLDTVVWAKQADVWKRIDARGVLLGRHCPDQCIGYSLGDGKTAWAYKVS